MKLFTRYTRLNLSTMFVVFAIGAGALFFTFRYILIHQVDEGLEAERDEALQYIKQYSKLPAATSVEDLSSSYIQVASPSKATIKTTRRQGISNTEDVRQISFPIDFEGRHYQAFVTTGLEQTQYLIRAFALVTLAMIVVMLLAIYLINRKLVKHLLKPFYQTIGAVSTHSLTDRHTLQLPQTPIEEFTTLNKTLNEMAARGQRDYQLMRDFTAQAAHEMQTPLALIRTKLDALMQTPHIDEAQATGISAVDDSVERLTRLFNSLLLLTKIENGQFPVNEAQALDEIVNNKRNELSEVIEARKLTVTFDMQHTTINCNRYLTEVLVSNLLNNAIRYNYPGGAIDVTLQQGQLVVSNTSVLPPLDSKALFRPFYRDPDNTQDGNGLGLSIVKQICEASGFDVAYRFTDRVHQFILIFPRNGDELSAQ